MPILSSYPRYSASISSPTIRVYPLLRLLSADPINQVREFFFGVERDDYFSVVRSFFYFHGRAKLHAQLIFHHLEFGRKFLFGRRVFFWLRGLDAGFEFPRRHPIRKKVFEKFLLGGRVVKRKKKPPVAFGNFIFFERLLNVRGEPQETNGVCHRLTTLTELCRDLALGKPELVLEARECPRGLDRV